MLRRIDGWTRLIAILKAAIALTALFQGSQAVNRELTRSEASEDLR
jgi:hypothetical protein